nr:uncharacterized protein LOC128681248 [Plodia interpunctella]
MFSAVAIFFVLISVQAHQNPPQNDADLQSELMPQELNPEFVSAQEPYKISLPLTPRGKRSPSTLGSFYTTQLKHYSRIASCVVLALTAVIEIVLFILEQYLVV